MLFVRAAFWGRLHFSPVSRNAVTEWGDETFEMRTTWDSVGLSRVAGGRTFKRRSSLHPNKTAGTEERQKCSMKVNVRIKGKKYFIIVHSVQTAVWCSRAGTGLPFWREATTGREVCFYKKQACQYIKKNCFYFNPIWWHILVCPVGVYFRQLWGIFQTLSSKVSGVVHISIRSK